MAREISNNNFQLNEDLPDNFSKSVQFFTFLDLVSDGAEIEGFSTPSKNNLPIPSSLLNPSTANDPELVTEDEKTYIQLAQQDIFLDGRAIRDEGGNENIINTALAIRTGSENQPIMTGVNEFKKNGNLTSAKVLNNGNAELNKVTGTIDAGIDVNSTPKAVIITLRWPSLRQLSADDGSTVGLGINTGDFKGDSGSVDILLRIRNKDGIEIKRKQVLVNTISVGQYSVDYRLEIPASIHQDLTAINDNYPLSVDVLRSDQEFRDSALGRSPFSKTGRRGNNIYEEGTRRFTEFFFSGLQGVIPLNQANATFPKSAYIGLRYSAEQFPNIPQRKYFIRGIKVRIPTGVTIDTANTGRILYPSGYTFGALTGVRNQFNGKFWTTDPAWILYALLTEDYGLNIEDSKIDSASFFAASKYCCDFNNTGLPRFSFNGVLNKRKKALDVIKEIASLMRATLYYKNGSIKIAIDKPETITSYLFTNANVVDGAFNYSGNDKDKKYTQINVSYFNNDIQELDLISVEEPSMITKLGLNQTNISALHTTDRQQAKRLGRTILYASLFESEIITFDCGLEAAAILEPFDIIKVADRLKETFRASGRINSVTSSTVVVVDDSTDTTVGTIGDTFLIIDKKGNVQEKTISGVNGSSITLSNSFSSDELPQAGTIWAVKTQNIQHRKFRVTNIKQKDNFTFTVTAITYDDNKYSYIDDQSSNFGEGDAPSTLLDTLDPPEIFELKEELIIVNERATSRIVLNFAYVNGAKRYQVSYKHDNAPTKTQNVFDNQFILHNNAAGSYEFTVKSVNTAHLVSKTGSVRTILAEGLSDKPSAVSNLRAEESGDNLILKFDRATDKDVLFGGFVDVKLALITDGTATLQDSNPAKRVDGNINEIVFNDFQSGEYFLKFIDVNLNESEIATSVVVNRTISSNNLLAAEIRENTNNASTTFSGSKVNLEFDQNIGGLKLSSAISFDSISNFDTLTTPSGNFASLDLVTAGGGSGIPSEGIYTFAANNIDLGAAFRLHVEPHFKKSGFDTLGPTGLWDSHTDLMDDWPDIFTGSTTVVDKSADLVFQVAKSQTATASTTFETFVNTDMIAQTLSFKVLVQNQSTYENVDIEELGVNLIFRPRTERSIDYQFNSSDNVSVTNGVLTSSSSGATTVTFVKKFFTGTTAVGGSTTAFNPVVFININNMSDNDFFTVTNVSGTGFTVSIKNGSSFVQRDFTYSAFGYGEG
tara:strand:+ start:1511 stop:5182 length:3672 start_codon:yes stop_codon:yes gene_type:complete